MFAQDPDCGQRVQKSLRFVQPSVSGSNADLVLIADDQKKVSVRAGSVSSCVLVSCSNSAATSHPYLTSSPVTNRKASFSLSFFFSWNIVVLVTCACVPVSCVLIIAFELLAG
jgi:hypothetical protein